VCRTNNSIVPASDAAVSRNYGLAPEQESRHRKEIILFTVFAVVLEYQPRSVKSPFDSEPH